jgi:hypothetical protein
MNKRMKHILQFLLLLFFTTLWGCGDSGRIPVYPVRGKVTLDGQPAVGAYVIFHPTTKDEKKIGLKPRGVTNDDGEFVLRTYESGDGAPEGDYQVITFWGSPDDLTEEGIIPENWRSLMQKYGQRRNPQFTATVEIDPQTESGENIISEMTLISESQQDSDAQDEDY